MELEEFKKIKRHRNSKFLLKAHIIFYFGNESATRLNWRYNITDYKFTEISRHFFVKFFETIFLENMLSGSVVVTSVQKDRLKNFPENVKQIWVFWRERRLSVW